MTCPTVWTHQPSDCSLMIVWSNFTKRATLSKTLNTSKQTSMHCRPGSVSGWWVFIRRNVNYESHGNHVRSSISRPYNIGYTGSQSTKKSRLCVGWVGDMFRPWDAQHCWLSRWPVPSTRRATFFVGSTIFQIRIWAIPAETTILP